MTLGPKLIYYVTFLESFFMQKNTIRFFVFLVFQCTAVLLHYYSLLLLYFQLLKGHVQARLGSGHDGANPIKVPVIW